MNSVFGVVNSKHYIKRPTNFQSPKTLSSVAALVVKWKDVLKGSP